MMSSEIVQDPQELQPACLMQGSLRFGALMIMVQERRQSISERTIDSEQRAESRERRNCRQNGQQKIMRSGLKMTDLERQPAVLDPH